MTLEITQYANHNLISNVPAQFNPLLLPKITFSVMTGTYIFKEPVWSMSSKVNILNCIFHINLYVVLACVSNFQLYKTITFTFGKERLYMILPF